MTGMFLALREMRRAKVRFGLLIGAVGLLVFLILFQQALLGGLINQFIGALKNQSGDVVVYNAQARRNLEGSLILPAEQAAVEQAVAAADPAAVVGPLGENTFTVNANGDDIDAVVFGYTLQGAGEPSTLVEGRLPNGPGEAVASELNRNEGFGIGDVVELRPGGTKVTVVGLADSINYSVSPTVFVSIDTYEAAVRAANPDATAVPPSVLVVETDKPLDVVDAIERVAGVEALTRAEAIDKSPGVSSVRSSFRIVLGLFYVVVPLVVGLFFLIVTLQKANALTLLRAIGASSGSLVKSLMVQVVIVVIGGSLVAVGLFAGAAQGAANLGIEVELRPIVFTTAVILVLGLAAAVVAARRVNRIDPIDATTGAGVRG
jgi:putative ABC transport system permease protein